MKMNVGHKLHQYPEPLISVQAYFSQKYPKLSTACEIFISISPVAWKYCKRLGCMKGKGSQGTFRAYQAVGTNEFSIVLILSLSFTPPRPEDSNFIHSFSSRLRASFGIWNSVFRTDCKNSNIESLLLLTIADFCRNPSGLDSTCNILAGTLRLVLVVLIVSKDRRDGRLSILRQKR
jgi:hypothetical protein